MLRHTTLTAVSYAVVGAVSILYGLLILRFFGNRPVESDAFFLAYAVYSTIMLFSTTLRISAVPLLVEDRNGTHAVVGRYGQVAIAVGAAFLSLALVVAIFSQPLGRLLGYGLNPEGRRLTGVILLAFAPAIALQGMGQLNSAALGARGDFDYVSLTTTGASIAGLLAFLLTSRIGILSVVLGLTGFNLLFAGALWARARSLDMVIGRQDWHSASLGSIYHTLRTLFSCSSVYVGFNAAYIISQSLSTTYSAGTPTGFAYAYTMAVLVISATTGSMGIMLTVRYRDYARGTRTDFCKYLIENTAVAGLMAAGTLGLLAAVARPLGLFIFTVLPAGDLPAQLGSERAQLFARALQSLAVGGYALAMFGVLAPATIAARRTRFFLTFTLLALAAHLAIGLALKRGMGPLGLGVGYSLTAAIFLAFQVHRLHTLFEGRLLAPLGRRLIVSAGVGAVAAAGAALTYHVLRDAVAWPVALSATVLLFAFLYGGGTIVWDRASWTTVLSHFRGDQRKPNRG